MSKSARKPVMAGNWKMHHNHFEAIQVVQKLAYRLEADDYDRCDVVVCPTLICLRSVQTVIESDRMTIGLGAQNCYFEEKGAFTGEVSAPMLAKMNVQYVIVGHSERREIFAETDEMVSKKTRAVLGAGMTPIVCCGETLEEREGEHTTEKVSGQIKAAFHGIKSEDIAQCIVAYEPIWAIGTGKTATSQEANDTIGVIRSVIREMAGAAADQVRILYGGSVKPSNVTELMSMPEIDGALVGGASLDPDDFAKIIKF